MSSSAARFARSGMRHAPSRIEYSEWTWRWTNGTASDTATHPRLRVRRCLETRRRPLSGAFGRGWCGCSRRLVVVAVAVAGVVGGVVLAGCEELEAMHVEPGEDG